MPKYYCDYCDAFLTHDSPSVRKTHNGGRKHKENVRHYYQSWMETQAQKLIDATTKAFTTQRMMAPISGMMPPPVTAAAMGMMPRPFVMPPGMMRPPMMPPMGVGPMPGAGFFPPPLPTGLPVPMPQSSVAPHPNIPIPVPTTSSNENGGGGMASIRTNIKME